MELRQALRLFGWESLRPGQKEAVDALTDGHDLLGVLPTGAGKSLCYQLPALMLGGWTLVISPLLALMRDQVGKLNERGIPARMLEAGQSDEEKRTIIRNAAEGKLRLLYIAPERMDSASVRALVASHPPKLLVVDEAHCVVRWGESFRPVYRRIGAWMDAMTPRPLVCAMTATASPSMRRTIVRSLRMRGVRRLVLPVRRENLCYQVLWTLHPKRTLAELLAAHPNEKTLIYCPTRRMTEETAAWIVSRGIVAEAYHAGLSAERRRETENRFRSGETVVLTATVAFGMGVDLPDIRLLVHLAPPASAEDYAQETGRAGRDGKPAVCAQLICPTGCRLRQKLLQNSAKEADKQGLRGKLAAWRRARDCDAVFRMLTGGQCIPQGLERFFGQRGKPCGHCGGCLRQGILSLGGVPTLRLSRADKTALRFWFLRVLRMRLAARYPRAKLPKDAELLRAARLLDPSTLRCQHADAEAALRDAVRCLQSM